MNTTVTFVFLKYELKKNASEIMVENRYCLLCFHTFIFYYLFFHQIIMEHL
jgi:hypothetical protein